MNALIPPDEFTRMIAEAAADGQRDALKIEDFMARYVRPAVEHDQVGAAILLYGERALQAFDPHAPLLKLTPPQG